MGTVGGIIFGTCEVEEVLSRFLAGLSLKSTASFWVGPFGAGGTIPACVGTMDGATRGSFLALLFDCG